MPSGNPTWVKGASGKGGNPAWVKGVSGNPSGRPKIISEIRDIAREHTKDAIKALVEVCRAGESESARVAAATALLDRGYGRPVQSVHSTPNDPAELTDIELARIAAGGSYRALEAAEDPPLAH